MSTNEVLDDVFSDVVGTPIAAGDRVTCAEPYLSALERIPMGTLGRVTARDGGGGYVAVEWNGYPGALPVNWATFRLRRLAESTFDDLITQALS